MEASAPCELFGGPAPRVRTLPPSAHFLSILAERLIAEIASAHEPFALADALVLVPNRRIANALIEQFAQKSPHAAVLPAIRPIADLEDDAEVWGPAALDLSIPASIDPLRRRLELAALLRARDAAEGGVDDPARALAVADELCAVLDAAGASDHPRWDKLAGLVERRDLARHWERSVRFLNIIAQHWPQRLAQEGLCDPAERRTRLLTALADYWRKTAPTRPIVIAGSTGSIPAVRDLMRVVAALPRGAVLLPGLDRDLDAAAWAALGPQHPQAALKETLIAFSVERHAVPYLQGASETTAQRARRALMREALAPADATADWLQRLRNAGGADAFEPGLEGLSRLACETEEEEALAVALMFRHALETPGVQCALVTPDRNLSARVAAKMRRWGIEAAQSAGAALRESAAGQLVQLALQIACNPEDKLAIAALLQHPNACFATPLSTRLAAREALLRKRLRGARKLAFRHDEGGLVAALLHAIAPLRALIDANLRLSDFARALHEALVLIVTRSDEADGEDFFLGEEAASLMQVLEALVLQGDALGEMRFDQAQRAFLRLLGEQTVPARAAPRARVSIMGPLEARLQNFDFVVLGGLNEGVWPRTPREDPFLSRAMRKDLNFPDPDARLGLSAHDFAQAVCAPRVVLTRSLRVEGAPSVASRWLWRLETLLKGAALLPRLDPPIHDDPRPLARRLDKIAPARRASPPEPRPPKHARLRKLSITEVETLIRDPYAIYARRILGLQRLKSIGAEMDAGERGSIIHTAAEEFSKSIAAGAPAQAAALAEILRRGLQECGVEGAALTLEEIRLASAINAFAAWAQARVNWTTFVERPGKLALANAFELSGRADRIDVAPSGDTEIIDLKSGRPPTKGQVESGLSPQLLLEAAILARGGFEGAPKLKAAQITYWRFGGLEPGPELLTLSEPVAKLAQDAIARLTALVAHYAAENAAFYSKPRAKFANEWADFDHLARRKEWAQEGQAE